MSGVPFAPLAAARVAHSLPRVTVSGLDSVCREIDDATRRVRFILSSLSINLRLPGRSTRSS